MAEQDRPAEADSHPDRIRYHLARRWGPKRCGDRAVRRLDGAGGPSTAAAEGRPSDVGAAARSAPGNRAAQRLSKRPIFGRPALVDAPPGQTHGPVAQRQDRWPRLDLHGPTHGRRDHPPAKGRPLSRTSGVLIGALVAMSLLTVLTPWRPIFELMGEDRDLAI